MKWLLKLSMCILLACMCVIESYGLELTREVKFNSAKIKTRDVKIGGKNFTSVDYDGLINTETVGEASLPFSLLEFEVPSDIFSFSVSAEIGETKVIPLNFDIEVSQIPVRTDYIGIEPQNIISKH